MSLASKKSRSLQDDNRGQTVYSRILDRELPVHDAREEFARPSWRSAREKSEIQAFLESKRQMIRSHPQLTAQEKEKALAEIDARSSEQMEEDAEEDDPDAASPPPGGVGFGVFYQPEYKVAWETGSALELYIVCPTVAGGNVSTWLYLTATNRTAKGVEALVSYHSQEEFRLTVFDWSRSDRWQIDRPCSTLGSYLRSLEIGGVAHQVLHVLNSTHCAGDSGWTNEVYLVNNVSGQVELIYGFDYRSTVDEQKTGWIGSWGPLVETFQDCYQGTNRLGFADVSVGSCRASARWDWETLRPSTSYLREDGSGFSITFFRPNHTMIVES